MSRRLRLYLVLGLVTTSSAYGQPMSLTANQSRSDTYFGHLPLMAASSKSISLSEAITRASKQYPGKVLSAKFNERSGQYQVRVLDRNGRMHNINIDANNGSIIRKKRGNALRGGSSRRNDILKNNPNRNSNKNRIIIKRRNGG